MPDTCDDADARPTRDQPAPQPRRRRRKVLVRVLAVLIGMLGAFLFAEVVVRLVFDPVDLLEITGRKPVPERVKRFSWRSLDPLCAFRPKPGHGAGTPKSTNSDGYISTPELPVEKAAGEIRLAFIGGSSTAGQGLDDVETWPWRVCEHLQAARPDAPITFLNAGAPGYSTVESLNRFITRVRYHQPDIAVVYHGWNDMYYFRNPASLRTKQLPRDDIRITRLRPAAIDPLLAWSQVLSRVRLATGTSMYGEAGWDHAGSRSRDDLATDFDPAGLEVFRENLTMFRDAAQALGVKLFVVHQATLITRDLPADERERCRIEFHGFDYAAHLRAWDGVYGAIADVIPADRIIDARSLSGVPELFDDHIHLTPEGAARLAELVAGALQPHVTAMATGGSD